MPFRTILPPLRFSALNVQPQTTSVQHYMVDSRYIPTQEELNKARNLKVLDDRGQKIHFGSIFANQRTIVVFIRHFFCGRCKEYVEDLAKVPKEKLGPTVQIVVIGCGGWQPIKDYAETTGFQGKLYADSTRELYHALGMNIEKLATTPATEQKRSYIRSSTVSNALLSFWRGPLTHPGLIGKQGNISQLGGEFIFGPGETCSFASRMQHTEDHVEVDDLLKAAGVLDS